MSIQTTLDGSEAEPDLTLDEAASKVWDDGDVTPLWDCPECELALCSESTCPECGWFDRDRWDATLERYVDTGKQQNGGDS